MAVIADDDLVTRIVHRRLAASRAERREQHEPPVVLHRLRSAGSPRAVQEARVGPAHPDGLCTTCKQREDRRGARRAARPRSVRSVARGGSMPRIWPQMHLPGAVGEMTRLRTGHLPTAQQTAKIRQRRCSKLHLALRHLHRATPPAGRSSRTAPGAARLLRAFLMMDREQGIEFEQAFAWSVEDVLEKRLPAATSAEQSASGISGGRPSEDMRAPRGSAATTTKSVLQRRSRSTCSKATPLRSSGWNSSRSKLAR